MKIHLSPTLRPSPATPGGRRQWLLAAATLVGLTGLALPGAAPQAQGAPATGIDGTRNFPAGTRLGELVIGVFPQASIDGKETRFSAAGRLHDTNNLIIQPSTVYGQKLQVRYELDFEGSIRRAWLLNEAELKIAQDEAAARR